MQITRRHAARSERTFRDTAKQGPGVGISPNRSGISERSTQPDRKLPDLKASLVLSIGVTMCALSPEPLVANVQYDRLRKRGGADALRHRRTGSPPNIAGVKPKPCELAIRAVSYEVAIAASPEPSRSQSRSCLLFRAHANKRHHTASRQATNGVANWKRIHVGEVQGPIIVAGHQRCRQLFVSCANILMTGPLKPLSG